MDYSQTIETTHPSGWSFVSASAYTFDQLAEFYNQTRVDYIVPMPMNGKRLADYVHFYDVDLDLSTVVLNSDNTPVGLIMVGIRGDHGWITRLGVLPGQRGQRVGQALMEISLAKLEKHGARHVQLEVITGNEPAYRLFLKLGFVAVQDLLVIRRPPKLVADSLSPHSATVSTLDDQLIVECLESQERHVAWTEATASLLNIKVLRGIRVELLSGEIGWLIYQFAPFELTHVVINADASSAMMRGLIYQLHKQHPLHDTKIENLPRAHPAWQIFQEAGYLEVFSRIELQKHL